jgi:hypothetical protein
MTHMIDRPKIKLAWQLSMYIPHVIFNLYLSDISEMKQTRMVPPFYVYFMYDVKEFFAIAL